MNSSINMDVYVNLVAQNILYTFYNENIISFTYKEIKITKDNKFEEIRNMIQNLTLFELRELLIVRISAYFTHDNNLRGVKNTIKIITDTINMYSDNYLKKEIEDLKQENEDIKKENEDLKKENQILLEQYHSL